MRTPVVAGIGPTSVRSAAAGLDISVDRYVAEIRSVARTLARWRVLLVVNGDSESTCILGRAFLDAGENTVRWFVHQRIAPCPVDARSRIAVMPAKEIPTRLLRTADVVVCVGFGTGTALEVCLAKFESSARVLVVRELISSPLPRECAFDRLSYIGIDDLPAELSSVLGPPPEEARAYAGVARRPA